MNAAGRTSTGEVDCRCTDVTLCARCAPTARSRSLRDEPSLRPEPTLEAAVLRDRRVQLGLNRSQVIAAMGLGRTSDAVRAWERGERRPTPASVATWRRALDALDPLACG